MSPCLRLLTLKRQREPEQERKDITENKKKKEQADTDEFDSIIEHLKVIVVELESSNFSNAEY